MAETLRGIAPLMGNKQLQVSPLIKSGLILTESVKSTIDQNIFADFKVQAAATRLDFFFN